MSNHRNSSGGRGAAVLAATAVLMLSCAVQAVAHAQNEGPWTAPERAAQRANPVLPTASTVDQGRLLFQRDCVTCHGNKGHGDGQMSYSLPLKPADLASQKVQSQTDGALFWKIYSGRGVMPSTSSTLQDSERWAVIDYVRTLAKK